MKNKVLCGVDRIDSAESLLRGKHIALLTSASGVNRDGIPTYEIIKDKYSLDVLLAPEHGLRSNLQDGGFNTDTDCVDSETGAVICNLSSNGNPRLNELLSRCDVAVYDIQDVGARFYTYLCNLTQLMRGCASMGIPLLVLDRPNPIGGERMDGAILDETKYSSFIGEYAIPTRYGLTVGEYAKYVNSEKNIGCGLHILECDGWKRNMFYDDTDLLFVNPSPNIPSVSCMFNYIGGCIWEATNVSEGRGTTRPFDFVGAPFVNSSELCDELRSYKLPGVVFRRVFFTPQYNKYLGEVCEGVELHITDRSVYEPITVMLYIFRHMKRYSEFTCRDNGLCLRFGNDMLLHDYDIDVFRKECDQKLNRFGQKASEYKIY